MPLLSVREDVDFTSLTVPTIGRVQEL